MNRLLAPYGLAGLLVLLVASPLWGQTGSSGSSGTSGTPRPSGPPGGGVGPGRAPGRSVDPSAGREMPTPMYVDGRVITETGQPAPEPIPVALVCGARRLQAIRTDLNGYFKFTFGMGVQSNFDLSAADASMSPSSSAMGMEGLNISGVFGGYGASLGSLTGCELRISVPGYQPITHIITDPASLGTIDVGTLELRRIAGVQGSTISATSLLAPSTARKEFDKGVEDVRRNNLKSATQHLEKAVAEYDKYATAWNELGGVYSANRETAKARLAFERAIAADSQFVPPYVSLSILDLQDQKNEEALEAIGKALELDPAMRVGVAGYIQTVANYRLNRLEAAEKSALEAEKGPHQNTPQLHAILADIFLRKRDYPNAAAQMRAYLKEVPQGPLAGQMKSRLEQIEKTGVDSSAPGRTAP